MPQIDSQSAVMIIIFIVSGFGALVKYIAKQHENQITSLKIKIAELDSKFTDTHDRRVREFMREIKEVRNCIQTIKVRIGEMDGRLKSVGDYHESLRLLILEKGTA